MFQQSTQHVASYYAHSCADRLVNRPALRGEQDTDILIIGAGFSGLHTALRLALAGKRVTLLEASRVAWAASGRNGGQAILGWSCDSRRWKPRWVTSAHAGCGTACAGRRRSCVNYPLVMASIVIIARGICGRRSCHGVSGC
ncbi:FAD dependent oxidoreductase [Pseudomonas sp. OV226]|nr:FAD dependent oxidoreductase [Pseudomonas sp. OV226]